MWKRLNETKFNTSHVIIGGNFNHLEETDQRGKSGEGFMMNKEVAFWHHMTFQYGLADTWKLDNFPKMSKKEYTFDNGRSGMRSVVSHIDKFIVSQDLDTRQWRIEATTSIRKLSDHSPLVLTIWGQPTESSKQNKYFDSSLLRVETCKATMLKAWEGKTPKPSREAGWAPWIETTIQRDITCNASLIKERNHLKGMQVKAHSRKIQLAEV